MALLTPSLVRLGAAPATKEQAITAARDPLRVIPALVLGSAIAGAISMAAGVELRVPQGGAFVLPIPNAATHLGSYVAALVVGAIATALTLRVTLEPVP